MARPEKVGSQFLSLRQDPVLNHFPGRCRRAKKPNVPRLHSKCGMRRSLRAHTCGPAVVFEGAMTLEIEAEAAGGFADADVGIIRDNAKQLKFKAGSAGFGDQARASRGPPFPRGPSHDRCRERNRIRTIVRRRYKVPPAVPGGALYKLLVQLRFGCGDRIFSHLGRRVSYAGLYTARPPRSCWGLNQGLTTRTENSAIIGAS
jgi:hypothetical protein